MQKDLILEEYLNKLSSSSPTPGGGSAAAVAGALSSALTSMVFNLTIGKKSYNELEMDEKERIDKALETSNIYNKKLLEFMDKDSDAFSSFMDTFKLPKETDEEKRYRENEIQKGYVQALQVPLDLAEHSLKLYEEIIIASKYGNKNVLSDAAVAAILLNAAIESSIVNVKVNLVGLKDTDYKEKIEIRCNEIIELASGFKKNALDIINNV